MWNYEGLKIKALYKGSYPIEGKVYESRFNSVEGKVYHRVDLKELIEVNGKLKDVVVINHNDITSIYN
jgi:hypothetical protein